MKVMDTGSAEFVAAAPEDRGQGIAAALISHIMEDMPYQSDVLEAADADETAVRLYRRLGFAEFMRTK
ncbi:MAG: GNAT family N-acetyltransferase [Clostridium sp.]|jgi:ribosomal protein S18 acetylase RimI-like enzyme|nr:GNAT family N-acetyltransferase [Clostridium sp.]